ncbi:IS5 family transposase [Novosphingobium sp. HK4-1]|uniref:IS5 family transposase n=1 Tax=Novosphingobium mangrovi (ex Huang et al. 2023) TaxID=2976432 RepID=A0ABT2I8P0_9SPHN|nr:IS5 family transposase [Novosphingobium mangrovi (ex Huang et al. 2023)]MCT2401178.1 IS5 family transposase [Novosphingobium mangrovi (ex Huang et al. 2023)]
MARGDLTDEEWEVIAGLLSSERNRKSRPLHDNRRFLDGMLHMLRVGGPWRDMHERDGLWNAVYVRFRRWAEQGVWDAILATLMELGLTDDWQHMIDSTTVRGHVSAVGGKGGRAQAFGRSRGGFTCKVHARCDDQGRPLGFIPTRSEVSDYGVVGAMIKPRFRSPAF